MKITEPGIYRDFDVRAYHDDPAPEPSLSQSIAKILLDQSPLHAAVAHPRLMMQQADEEENAEKYVKARAIGDAAHALMIGRGKDLAICQADSWRSDKAKDMRAGAEAAGHTPILHKHYLTASIIAEHARTYLADHEERDCFLEGAGEVALIWQEGRLWFRCLVDWLHDDLRAVEDFKTTELSVADHNLGRIAANAGWHIQAAMIERGLNALDPAGAGRRKIRFVAQEQSPPYALNVMLMTEAWLTMGRKMLDMAVHRWAICTENNTWPAYGKTALTPEFPGWTERAILDRELANEPAPNVLMAG